MTKQVIPLKVFDTTPDDTSNPILQQGTVRFENADLNVAGRISKRAGHNASVTIPSGASIGELNGTALTYGQTIEMLNIGSLVWEGLSTTTPVSEITLEDIPSLNAKTVLPRAYHKSSLVEVFIYLFTDTLGPAVNIVTRSTYTGNVLDSQVKGALFGINLQTSILEVSGHIILLFSDYITAGITRIEINPTTGIIGTASIVTGTTNWVVYSAAATSSYVAVVCKDLSTNYFILAYLNNLATAATGASTNLENVAVKKVTQSTRVWNYQGDKVFVAYNLEDSATPSYDLYLVGYNYVTAWVAKTALWHNATGNIKVKQISQYSRSTTEENIYWTLETAAVFPSTTKTYSVYRNKVTFNGSSGAISSLEYSAPSVPVWSFGTVLTGNPYGTEELTPLFYWDKEWGFDSLSNQLLWAAGGDNNSLIYGHALVGEARFNIDTHGIWDCPNIPGNSPMISRQFTTNEQAVTLLNFSFVTKTSTACVNSALSSTAIASTLPWVTDGTNVVEQGFITIMEKFRPFVATGPAGSLVAGKKYYYKIMCSWQDARGNFHYSTPTVSAAMWTEPSSGGTGSVSLSFDVVTFTRRTGVTVELYGAVEAAPLEFGLITTFTLPDVGYMSKTYTDTGSWLTGGALTASLKSLYTEGNISGYVSPPPSKITAVWDERQWYVDEEHSNKRLYYSNRMQVGLATSFASELYVDILSKHSISGLAAMGRHFVVFTEGETFVLAGTGYSSNISGQNYSVNQINTQIGCKSYQSVLEIPNGIMFESQTGIQALNENLTFGRVGEAVRRYTDKHPVTATTFSQAMNEARFYRGDNIETLIFNVKFQKWSIDSYSGNDAARISFPYVTRDIITKTIDAALIEDQGVYLDGAAGYYLSMETGWLSFANLEGFQRIFRVFVTAQKYADHSLWMKVAYDYDNTWYNTDHIALTTTNYANMTDEALYNMSASAANKDKQMRIEFVLPRTKCTAIKIKIYDSTAGQTLALSAIEFLVSTTRRSYLHKTPV